MSSPKWTLEQQAAIDLRGQLLVAAAAGSGKTAVLVERLIRRITDSQEGVDVDRFLVVTFTKAAANEMRERVGKALDDALFTEIDPTEVERLLHQRALLNRASITTLHSFCMELIRRYFYQLELDPAFRVADAAEADLLRQDTIEDLFETYYEREDIAFQDLVDAFGTDRDDHPLMEQVLRLYEFAISQAHPIEWLAQLPQAYLWASVDDLVQSPWGEAARLGILDKVEEGITLLERSYKIATQPGGPLQYSEILQNDILSFKLLERTIKEGTWDEVEECFNEATSFTRLPTSTKKAKSTGSGLPIDEELQKSLREESKKARDEAKKKLDKLKISIFSFPLDEQLPLLKEMSILLQTLSTVVHEFAQDYAASKRLRNIVDFSDLEHFALRLLEEEGNAPSAIAQNLQEHYEEVLVDEYQDINPVQERILRLVSRQEGLSPNLFMVGDVKQSIYRFRMADPSLFLKKYDELPHWQPNRDMPNQGKSIQDSSQSEPIIEATSGQKLVIDLNRNFRSRLEVIEGVNFLFRQIMTKGAGEIAYDDQASLCHGASFVTNQALKTAEGPIELHLFDPKAIRRTSNPTIPLETDLQAHTDPLTDKVPYRPSEAPESFDSLDTLDTENEDHSLTVSDDPSLEDLVAARIEARLVATRIQDMVKEGEFQVHDKHLGDFRPVQYCDIVILMRSFSSVAPVFVEEFQSSGIPVYAETSSGYFGASEVETILSLLKVIDNPRLDIPLAAVLRSPLVDMNGTELGKIRSLLPNGDFYEALVLAFWASNSSPTESPWLSEMEETLNIYQKSLPQLLIRAKQILKETPELQSKVESFWPKLQAWRQLSRRTSLADLLWQLYEETGYLAYVGTLPSGVQRQANLRVLYDRACRYEATNYRGLFRFLRFLEKFQGQGKDLGNARALGEKEDVVRLITVHSSKGLEFPVVFMVGLGTKFNTRSLNGRLLLHSELGAGIPLMDIENQVRYPSFIQYAVKERLWQESLAEELRILYVALTRAKERLLLYGTVGKLDETLNKWERLATSSFEVAFPDGQLRGAKNFLDWIGPALMRHPANLFGEERPPLDLKLPDSFSAWEVVIHQTLSSDSLVEPLTEPLANSADYLNQTTSSSEPLTTLEELNIIPAKPETLSLGQLREEVNVRLSWQYPHPEAVTQSAKTSVSELKRRFPWHTDTTEQMTQIPLLPISVEIITNPDLTKASDSQSLSSSSPVYTRPKFVQTKKELTPTEKGIALHTLVQHLPFEIWGSTWPHLSNDDKNNHIFELLESLVRREILTEEQSCVVQVNSILSLLNSATGTRLLKGDEVRREVPFTLSVKLKDQYEPVLVQGVIDAVIVSRREETAEVLDFKTDNLHFDSEPEKTLIERYALQLALYSQAVERLMRVSVKQCTLYSTSLSREFIVPQELLQAHLSKTINL